MVCSEKPSRREEGEASNDGDGMKACVVVSQGAVLRVERRGPRFGSWYGELVVDGSLTQAQAQAQA